MKEEERDYALYRIRQIRTDNRFIFCFSIIVSLILFYLFDFYFWWTIPVMTILFCILETLMCIFGIVAHIATEITDD